MKLPDWYLAGRPQLTLGAQLYIDAFWDLCSERQFGYAMGPIPWSKIRLYALDVGLDPVMRRIFNRVIRDLDSHYTDGLKEKQRRQEQRTAAEAKKKAEDE